MHAVPVPALDTAEHVLMKYQADSSPPAADPGGLPTLQSS